MKFKIPVLMLILLMGWASQGSAKPTRIQNEINHGLPTNIKVSQNAKLPRFDYLIKTCRVAGDSFIYSGPLLSPVNVIASAYSGAISDETANAILKTVKVIQQPKHGVLVKDTDLDELLFPRKGDFQYNPNVNFRGKDQVIFSAQYNYKNYKIVMNLYVLDEVIPDQEGGTGSEQMLCPDAYNPKSIKLNNR